MEKTALILTIIASVISLLNVFFLFQANSRLRRMKRRYDNLLHGSGELNVEELLLKHGEQLEQIKHREKDINGKMSALSARILSSVSKVAFLNYNAYPDASGEKSYSLCLLDTHNNGVILTNLYGREHSVSFGKEIQGGNPILDLSPEEQIVLNKALSQ